MWYNWVYTYVLKLLNGCLVMTTIELHIVLDPLSARHACWANKQHDQDEDKNQCKLNNNRL